MKTGRSIALILIFTVLTFCLFGCGTDSAGSAAETETAADYSNTTVTGQVTAVDDDSVTLLLGELTENDISTGAAPSGGTPSGEAPSGEAPSGGAPSGGAPSGGAPSGEAPSGEMPSGETPSGETPSGGGRMKTFTAGTDSVTVTIGEDTAITVEGIGESTEGTTDDITVGSVLELTFGDNNTVTAVTMKAVGG
jgi:hypothetical protein